jgi:hypothetical protein
MFCLEVFLYLSNCFICFFPVSVLAKTKILLSDINNDRKEKRLYVSPVGNKQQYQDGSTPSKFCVLGQAGFPQRVPKRRRSGGFPLLPLLSGYPSQSLIATEYTLQSSEYLK